MTAGIYCIRSTVSGRRYVGSAVNIKQRWCLHRSLLAREKHHSPAFQRSWIKHGEDAFVFEVLELVEDKGKLIEREQFWIDKLCSCCPKTGFNVAPTAGSPLGRRYKQTTEARANIARSNTERNRTPEMRAAASLRIAERNRSDAGKKRAPYSAERLEKLRAVSIKKGGRRLVASCEKQKLTRELKEEHRMKYAIWQNWHDFGFILQGR